MNIVLLTVSTNYHVPVLLRDLFRRLEGDRIRIYTSASAQRFSFNDLAWRYGAKYSIYKLMERLTYSRLVKRERKAQVGFPERHYLSLREVVDEHGLKMRITRDVNQNLKEIERFRPEILISLYFDQLLQTPLLRLSSCEALNLHPSLLPAYAGSSPIFHTLAAGESHAGITIHRMTEEIDAGGIVFQEKVPILEEDTLFSLYRRCTLRFLEPLSDCIEARRQEKRLMEQDPDWTVAASNYSKIGKEEISGFIRTGRRFI